MRSEDVTIKRFIEDANNLMTKVLIIPIKVYKKYISPLKGRTCRFYPSCSQYAVEALEKYGVFKGTLLSLKRILRCHPFDPGGYDPIK